MFAWSYEEMPGLDLFITIQSLNIRLKIKPYKKQQRTFFSYLIKQIKNEVKKLIKVGSI